MAKATEWTAALYAGNSSNKRFEKLFETIGKMHKTGVPFLAGTDLGNPFIFAGFSLHDELEMFVKAGFTPMESLQTATINPAKFLGKEKDLGTVQRGKLADLVLLDANPLENISNTRRISGVVVRRQVFAAGNTYGSCSLKSKLR